METVWELVVVVHLVGMAAVVGGWLTQVGAARPHVPVAVLYGAAAQVISGPVLVGLASSGAVDHDVDNAKVGVKLVVALAVFAVANLGRRRDDEELAGDRALPAPAAAGAAGTVATPAPASGPATGWAAARAADWQAPVHVAGVLALVNVLIAVLWR